jgi:thiol-disulfide isomerase/thioredoxin
MESHECSAYDPPETSTGPQGARAGAASTVAGSPLISTGSRGGIALLDYRLGDDLGASIMMTRRRLGLVIMTIALASTLVEAQAGPIKVSGRVELADGKPAGGVEVASNWNLTRGNLSAYEPATTDADGRFTIPLEFFSDRPVILMAADKPGQLGGVFVVEPKKATDPFEIKLAPLARVRGEFVSDDPAHPVTAVVIDVMFGRQGPPFAQCSTYDVAEVRKSKKMPEGPARFELRLPPGEFDLQYYVPVQPASHQGAARLVTIKPEEAGRDRDLGKIELKVNPVIKRVGKEPPPLQIKDARGVPKDVKLADFKGKYVLIEFWATWCGPCIGRGLPDLMELYDEHEADRDKFVVLAIHGQGADDFADLDKKLVPIVRDTWQGRPLPFPILLDDDGQTFEAYGIQGIPASILIDPQGKVVAGSGAEALMEVLPKLPIAKRLPRALDRQVQFAIGPKGGPLENALVLLGHMTRVEIKPDADAMARLGVKPDANVPLTITGQVSLRSWLDLILDPFGLVAVPGPEGLIVTTPDPAKPREKTPSAPQALCAGRIGGKLKAKTHCDFAKATLHEVAKYFEVQTGENFVLDPTDRRAGRLDPEATVTGKLDDVPLKDALKTLLGPIGIEAVVRDEVVILSRIRP